MLTISGKDPLPGHVYLPAPTRPHFVTQHLCKMGPHSSQERYLVLPVIEKQLLTSFSPEFCNVISVSRFLNSVEVSNSSIQSPWGGMHILCHSHETLNVRGTDSILKNSTMLAPQHGLNFKSLCTQGPWPRG